MGGVTLLADALSAGGQDEHHRSRNPVADLDSAFDQDLEERRQHALEDFGLIDTLATDWRQA